MSERPANAFPTRVLLGVGLALAGPALYLALLGNPGVRESGAPAFIGIGAGVVLALAGLRRERRGWVRALALVAPLAGAAFMWAFFAWARLPRPQGGSERAYDFALPDGSGATVSLAELRERGPVLLVFFRGKW